MTKYWSKKYTLDEYEKMTWKTPSDELDDAVEDLLAEVKRLRGLLLEIWKHANECSEEPAEMDETLSAIARALTKEDMR